ncbi:MAG TPA: signal peptidase I [Candidatus Cybelea sp.]
MKALFAFALLWALSPSAAGAHAYIVGAQPPADSSYQQPAGAIAISFDEPVELLDSNAMQVFDGHGKRIDRRDAAVDPQDATRVIVNLPRRLDSGIYTVRWRVISADTHVVHGIYRIGVGVPVTQGTVLEAASPFDPSAAPASVLRWLSLMGALLAGGAIFLRWYLLDRLELAYPGGIATARRGALAGALVLLAVAIPSLIVQASAAGGAFGQDIGATLLRTIWGVAFLVRLVAAVVVLFVALFAWKPLSRIAIVSIVILLATFSASGHALAQSSLSARAIAMLVDFAHLAAAAAWIGGLFIIAAILLPLWRARDVRTTERTQALFVAFTPLAMACVAIIVVSGAYASVIHLGHIGDLVGSTYGRVLLIKIIVVAVLLLLGWRHFRIGAGRSAAPGIATLGYETLAGIVVALLTAILVGQMPPAHLPASTSSTPLELAGVLCILAIVRFASAKKGRTIGPSTTPATRSLDLAIIAGSAALFLITVVVGGYSVESASMWPTLQLNDIVLVDRLTYRLRSPRHDDLAVFVPPVESGGKDFVERVVGVPGDEIAIRDGILYRNGKALDEVPEQQPGAYDLAIRDYEIYIDGDPLDPRTADVPPRALWQAPDRIPMGFYLLLGDNRNYSYDSHIWGFAQSGGVFVAGPLATRNVRAGFVGISRGVIWPLGRL